MNGIIIDEFLIEGSPYFNDEEMDDPCTHALTGPFYFINVEGKEKFVSYLILTFRTHYNTVKVTEVNKS